MDNCCVCSAKTTHKCKSCSTPYCSVDCQRYDWGNGHQNICLKISPYKNEEFDTNNMVVKYFDGDSEALFIVWGEGHIKKRLRYAKAFDKLNEYKTKIIPIIRYRILNMKYILKNSLRMDTDLKRVAEILDYKQFMGFFLTPQLTHTQYAIVERFLSVKIKEFIRNHNLDIILEYEKKRHAFYDILYNTFDDEYIDERLEWTLNKTLSDLNTYNTKENFIQKIQDLIDDLNNTHDETYISGVFYDDFVNMYGVYKQQYNLRLVFLHDVLNFFIKNKMIAVWGDYTGALTRLFEHNYDHKKKIIKMELDMWDLNMDALMYIKNKNNVGNLYPLKVGDNTPMHVTLKKNTILYRAFGETPFKESWYERPILWFGFNPVNIFTYSANAEFSTHSYFDTREKAKRDPYLTDYIKTLGKMIVVKVKTDIRLPNMKNVNMVKHIRQQIIDDGSKELLDAFDYTVFVKDDVVHRKSIYEFDGLWAQFLCKHGYNGFIADSFVNFNEEVALCDFKKKVKIIDEFTPRDLGLHFLDDIYKKYPVKLESRSRTTTHLSKLTKQRKQNK